MKRQREVAVRRFFYGCIVVLLLTGCVQNRITASPAITETNGNLKTLAPTPYPIPPKISPTFPYPNPAEISPTPSASQEQSFPWLGQMSLLFQPGDLPDGVTAGQFSQTPPDYLQVKYQLPPDGAASVWFSDPAGGQNYGSVIVLAYQQPVLLEKISQILIQAEEARRQGTPLDGLGDYGFLYLPEAPGRDTALFFKACHSFVQIRLLAIKDPAIIQRYADRLFKRLQQVDCQGHLEIPILPPPPALPTLTPAPLASFSQGFTPVIQRLPDPEGANTIRAFAFPDQQHGWTALGAKILATTDGGKTWHAQTTTSTPVKQIVFLSAVEGWIETQEGFLITQDGGVNWQSSSSPLSGGQSRMPQPLETPDMPGLSKYSFCPDQAPWAGLFASINDRTGWAFCTSSPGDHYSYVKLYQTQDAGQHWQLINDNPPYGPWGSSSFEFIDDRRGWIAGTYGGFYSTGDGGKTWQALSPGSLDSGWITNLDFLSLETGFAILKGSSRNQGRDVLVKTQDGGLSWQNVFAAPAPPPWPDGPFQFFKDGNGIGSTGDSILLTTDAGQSWSQPVGSLEAPGCQLPLQITALNFPDPDHGWAIADCGATPLPALFFSRDGGRTWEEQASGINGSPGLVGLSFPDSQNGYLVTQTGDLFRTSDGGKTFLPVDNQSVHTRSLHFATPELGWEIRGNSLYQTRDGGQSWQAIPFSLPVQYFALLPGGQAWLVAGETSPDSGNPIRRVFSSPDGGQTWLEHVFGEIPVNFDNTGMDVIQFAETLHGWLRAGSELFYTSDGGKSWVETH